MEKKIKKYCKSAISILMIFYLLIPMITLAQSSQQKTEPLKQLENLQPNTGYEVANKYTISEIIGQIVFGFLSLLGVIFIILMLYGGYNWMTSAGDEQKLTNAKDTLRRAIIGLIIIIGADAIWYFIYSYLLAK
jgi:TRAP-type C4-dicarboxylate transport system permease small subunit